MKFSVIACLTRNPLKTECYFQGIPRQARDDKLMTTLQ